MGNIIHLLQLCLLGTFCQTRRHSAENSSDLKAEKRICPTKFEGVDDNLGYDFISHYGLDTSPAGFGVQRIAGSNQHQTAYRIRRGSADLRVPTRAVFSNGLPVQLSFAATLRMTYQTAQKAWDILRIQDVNGNLQFSIHINGRKKSIRLKFMNNRSKIRTAEFSLDNQYFVKFFNEDWHKLSLSISHRLVELYVDCDKVGSAFIPSLGSINSTGHILSGRRADGEIVTFDLQWLMLYCDPKTAEHDQCKELQTNRNREMSFSRRHLPVADREEIDVSDLTETTNGRVLEVQDIEDEHQYSAKRRLRDSYPETEELLPVTALTESRPDLATPKPSPSANPKRPHPKKKPIRDVTKQPVTPGPVGPPGPPGLPGFPGLPCLCSPGVPPPPLRLPADIEVMEGNCRIS